MAPKAVVAWAEHVDGQLSPSTRKRYLLSLATCEPHLVGRMVGATDGAIIRGLIAARRRVVSIATVRRDLTAVSRVLAYAQSVGWGEDTVAAPGDVTLPAEVIARAGLAPARGRFICRGCYYIYDEAQGAPQHFAKPGTAFDSLPSDWRCPDCGTDKSTFRPHIESAA